MKNTFLNAGWLYGCLVFFICGCNNPAQHTNDTAFPDSAKIYTQLESINVKLDSLEKMIRSGDVITRTGNDFTSQSLRMLNRRDQTFSHCGIAGIEHDSVFIYHALGGDANPDQFLRRDYFKDFADPADNRLAGIFRFNLSDSVKQKLTSVVQKFYRGHLKFDMAFDLKTDDKMYCAEFVYKSFLKASGNSMVFNKSHINNFEFIGVDDITMQPLSYKVALLNYGIY